MDDVQSATTLLRNAFPQAAMISIEFTHQHFNSGIVDSFWQVYVGFSDRPSIIKTGATVAEALERVIGKIEPPSQLNEVIGEMVQETIASVLKKSTLHVAGDI